MRARIYCLLALAAVFSGCSNAGSGGLAATPQASQRSMPRTRTEDQLYVAWREGAAGGGISVFKLGTNTPIDSIERGIDGPVDIATDPATGYVYVANGHGNNVTVYEPENSEPRHVITDGIDDPRTLAVHKDRLYVGNDQSLSVYDVDGTEPLYTISTVRHPTALRFDSQDNLYVGDVGGVVEYPAGGTVESRKMHVQITRSVAVDKFNHVYATSNLPLTQRVLVYPSTGTTTCCDIDFKKDEWPYLLTISDQGHLYVEGAHLRQFLPPTHWIKVYLADRGGVNGLYSIDDVDNPAAMVVDRADNLYVIVDGDGVDVYHPNESSVAYHIHIEHTAVALAIGPNLWN
jgi:hypothetical protein